MEKHAKHAILVFVIAALAGAALHFLYSLTPVLPCAILAPVDESLFQHLKLLFWPILAAALVLKKWDGRPMAPRLLGLLVSSVLMLVLGWIFHITLARDSLLFDIVLYAALMALALLAIPLLLRGKRCEGGKLWDTVGFLTVVLGVLLVLFTFCPPPGLLFTDLSGVGAPTFPTC